MWLRPCLVYANHLPSGDQPAWKICSGPVYVSLKMWTGLPFARSTYHKFSRLSVYAIFLLSGDQVGLKKNDPGVPKSIFCTSPLPSCLRTCSAYSPDLSEKDAIRKPSG